MPELTVGEVARAVAGSRVIGDDATATGLVADSRAVRRGSAFVAIRGGHAFVADAFRAGATFVVVQEPSSLPDGASAVIVPDVVDALARVAKAVRERMDVRVIGITGSTGKTLTKDFIAAALRTRLHVHAAPNSYNAEIGVPLTVLGCPDHSDVLVCELAARRSGEIADLADIVSPHIGVITGIGTAHLELFGSREVIARTKSALLTALPPDGLAVVPSGDDFLSTMSSATSARMACVGAGARVRYAAERITPDGRTHGHVWLDDDDVEVTLPVPGRALMRNAALAIRVAVECGIDGHLAASALSDAALSSWRMEITRVGTLTVVNDAWNANPTSMAATLRAVRELAGDRDVWAVLGRMAELGSTSGAEHRRVGRLTQTLGYAGLIAVGEGTDEMVAAAGDLAVGVGSVAEAAGAVRQRVAPGSVVVVKASRAVGLEGLVAQLVQADGTHAPTEPKRV